MHQRADQTLDREPPAPPRSPLAELMSLALPTVAQMASYTVMQFINTWMLSRLGAAAPTAAANAGLLAFALISFGVGSLLIVNTLVSQNYGQRDFAACGRYLWQGVWFSLGYSVLVLPALPFLGRAFGALGHGGELAGMEVRYLQVVLSAMMFKMLAITLEQFLIATNRPNQVLVASVIGVIADVAAGYTLIFGKFGVAPMGVTGAAASQNVGVFVEMCVSAGFVFLPASRRIFNVFDWRPRVRELKTLVTVGAGSGLQACADIVAWWLFMVAVMGKLGEAAMAANTFMFRYMVISFMPAFGISQAVTALVGRYIGMGKPDVAEQRAHLGFKVAAVYMTLCGVVFFVFRRALIGFFNPTPDVLELGAVLMVFAGVYQFFDATYIVYNGALRGAGDTGVPALVTAGLCWGIMVCGGYLVASYRPGWGVAGPWTVATIYGTVLGIFMFVRFKGGTWRRIRLEPEPITLADTGAGAPVPALHDADAG